MQGSALASLNWVLVSNYRDGNFAREYDAAIILTCRGGMPW